MLPLRRRPEFISHAPRIRQLDIERLPVPDTATQELRPCRHGQIRLDRLRKKLPELWMVPTQLMPGAVAMPANPGAQLFYFRHQFVPRKLFKVFVRHFPSSLRHRLVTRTPISKDPYSLADAISFRVSVGWTARIGLLIRRSALLDLPEVGKREGFPANTPGAALYFLDNDPRVGPYNLADVGNHRLGDVLDHLGCLAQGELTFKYLDCEDRKSVV